MRKKIGVKILCGIAVCSLVLGGCSSSQDKNDSKVSSSEEKGKKEEDGKSNGEDASATLVKGIYEFTGEQTGNNRCFFKFKEDGTYYGFFYSGGILDCGTYSVEAKEKEYNAEPGADGDWYTLEDNKMAKASTVIVMESFVTGVKEEVAYDKDQICDATLGSMASHITLPHKADYEYNAETDEYDIPLKVYYANGDGSATLTLYHNNKFSDYTGEDEVTGTWEQKDNIYTLKSDAGDSYTITLDESTHGREGEYAKGNDVQKIKNNTGKGKTVAVFRGEADGKKAVLKCLDNEKCSLEMGGKVVDSGYYTVANSYQYIFEFDSAGEIAGTADTDKGIGMLEYQGNSITVSMEANLKK